MSVKQAVRVKVAKRITQQRDAESVFEPPALSVEPVIQTVPPTDGAAGHSIETTDVVPGLRSATPKIQRKESDEGSPAPAPVPAPPPDGSAGGAEELSGGGTGTTTILAPTVSSKIYSGKTLQDVSNAMPEEPGSLTFDIAAKADGDPITKATVTVKQVMVLARWAERDKQCKPIQAAWDRFASALRTHEDEHVKINKQQLATAHDRYVGRAQSETQDVTTELENETFAAGSAFDTQTDHGKTATPSTTIDLGVKCDDKTTSIDIGGGDEEAVQAKLEVSEPGDPDEEEADRVAEQVMRMAEPDDAARVGVIGGAKVVQRCAACEAEEEKWKASAQTAGGVKVRRKCAECEAREKGEEGEGEGGQGEEKKERVRRKESNSRPVVDDSSRVTAVARSGGQPLDAGTRAFMEPRFGFDFSHVRVHSGVEAAEAARSVNAYAYTLGRDIVFDAGRYAPDNAPGRRLLAHELTHVVQQGAAGTRGDSAFAPAPPALIQRDSPPTAPAPAPAAAPPTPGTATPPNTAGMSADDARRLIYAQTTLKQVAPLEQKDKDTLQQATKDALVFSYIEKRNDKRKDLDQATKDYQTLLDNQKDKSGAPTDQEKNEKENLKKKVDTLDQEVKDFDTLIKPILGTLGVSEDQLVKLVSETFPELFVARGKKIALQQLQTNKDLAERERDKYKDVAGAGDIGKPKVDGLRNAAKDLVARRKAIEQQQLKIREADKDMPDGGLPDPSQQTSSAYDFARKDEIQADIAKKEEELTKTRLNYAAEYQILYREDVDLEKLSIASDDEIRSVVSSKVDDILENITKTQKNIEEGKIKIWGLQDIVSMTAQDLGVAGNPTLMGVVVKRREKEEKDAQDDEAMVSALKAFAMVAAAIASLATLNPAPLLIVGFALGTIEVIQHGSQVSRVSAARDVALDPAIAQMTTEEPQWAWLIISIAALVVDAVTGAALLRAHFKALKAAAQSLEAFSKAARRAFGEKEAERLIDVARRELKSGLNLTEQIAAIGGSFAEAERVRIGIALAKYMPEGYSEAFLQLTREGRIVTMSEEGIRGAYGAQAEAMIAKHPPGTSGGFYDKTLNRGTAFVKDQGTVLEISESVAHELTHGFQKATGALEGLRPLYGTMEFYEEMQAFKMQQGFIRNAAAEYGESAIPEKSKWLVKATEEEIAEQVTKRYGVRPDPEVGIKAPLSDDLINKMLQRTMKGIDIRADAMRRLEQKLPPP